MTEIARTASIPTMAAAAQHLGASTSSSSSMERIDSAGQNSLRRANDVESFGNVELAMMSDHVVDVPLDDDKKVAHQQQQQQSNQQSKYRPEIDGLRAFAVLAVVINRKFAPYSRGVVNHAADARTADPSPSILPLHSLQTSTSPRFRRVSSASTSSSSSQASSSRRRSRGGRWRASGVSCAASTSGGSSA